MPIFTSETGHVLYSHVPKTGGSAVEEGFAAAGYSAWLLERTSRRRPPNSLFRCSPQHFHADLLEAVLDLQALPHRLMIVRNPLGRFASEYLYRHRSDRSLSRTPDPDHLAAWGTKVLDRREGNPFVLDNHLRPQEEFWLPDAEVVRVEDGLAGVAEVIAGWGLPAVSVPDRPATSRPAEERVVLPSSLEDRLREVYAADFRRFGYS